MKFKSGMTVVAAIAAAVMAAAALLLILPSLPLGVITAPADHVQTLAAAENDSGHAAEQSEPPETEPVTEPETEPPPEIHTLTLSFVGDCMLATYCGGKGAGSFNLAADTHEPEYFFSGVADYFTADDWTIANCENVFTDRTLKEVYKGYTPAYWYRSKSANAGIFKAGSIEIVSLANNHSNDYGTAGYEDTVAALEAAEVEWGNNSKPLILEKYGFRIGVYLCTLYNDTNHADNILKWLAAVESETDYQIIYYHGGTERVYKPDAWRVRQSKRFIDAGADLVIGGHPHVLQPIENYNGVEIVNSLGNFIFGGSRVDDCRTVIFRKTLTVCNGELLSQSSVAVPCYEYSGQASNWCPVPVPEDDPVFGRINSFMRGELSSPK